MIAFPATTGPVTPISFANSGEKVTRIPMMNQVGVPIRIVFK